jgi:two-component system phosphate regulon sensor histidine kinase PhoR
MGAALFPTIAMIGVGIVLVIVGSSTTTTMLGVLVLALCTSVVTGYILGSIFVGKGASLARIQNDFVSNVSHELRTPLTSIRLFIESLRGNRLSDEEREQVLSLLGREAKRLEVLVGRTLELSKLQSPSRVWPKERVDISELVDEAIASFDAHTLDRPTKIVREIEPGLVVTGDRSTLVSAIGNLLGNAWKYTGDDKKISIVVRANGRWIDLAVRDNGIGIDRSERGEMTEQFIRGRAAQETGAPGYGLGLAFVSAIVRGHRGKLLITSVPGATEVAIRLRRRLREGTAPITAPPVAAS